jgi:uncharacterized protein YunC (DUF1805 family)
MFEHKDIEVGNKKIEALAISLLKSNLIVLRGQKGYIMCGYLNLEVSEKFNEAAVKITGVSSIEDALNATVNSCSSQASKLGIYAGQPIREVLPIIA